MKRLIIAFLIMVVGIGLSWVFLRPSEWATTPKDQDQMIATVAELTNDAERQSSGKLLWQTLRVGDPIFVEDKIRTSAMSSIKLVLNNSKTNLDIEENSLVHMKMGDKKLSLNMLEGRVFLKKDVEATDGLDLVSGNKRIEVKGDIVASVEKGDFREVDVIKGTATSVGENEQKLTAVNLFQDLSPSYGETQFSQNENFKIKWKPFKGNGKVSVEIGESSSLLKNIQTVSSGPDSGELVIPSFTGTRYWRLVFNKDGVLSHSAMMKTSLEKPEVPVLLYPSRDQVLRLEQKVFDFKWAQKSNPVKAVIEVSSDDKFSKIIESKDVTGQTFFTSGTIYPQGSYFWRIRSKLSGLPGDIISAVSPFKIVYGDVLLSPELQMPKDKSVFYVAPEVEKKTTLTWKPQKDVSQYQLKIEGVGSKEYPINGNQLEIKLNTVGTYHWSVTSLNKNGEASLYPQKRSFEVRPLQKVPWEMKTKTFYYLESHPIIILKWKKTPYQKGALLKISRTPGFDQFESFTLSGVDFPYRALSDGYYYARVEAMDDNGEVSGVSDTFEFNVLAAPLPPTPEYSFKGELLASSSGNVSYTVENFRPDFQIVSQIIDEKGMVIDERKFNELPVRFNNLRPGNYWITTYFEDQYKRKGESGQRMVLKVPSISVISPPKIKGIKVR